MLRSSRENGMARWSLACLLVMFGCGSGGGSNDDATDTAEVDAGQDGEDGDATADPADESGCTSDEECDDSDPCTNDTCLIDEAICDHEPTDADSDGFAAESVGTVACGGTDCDDDDDSVYPGSTLRVCDADADCNDVEDSDNDEDGHDSAACGGDDCQDDYPTVFPGAIPGCGEDVTDPLSDVDCNGYVDSDNDHDTYVDETCPGLGGNDCDDTSGEIHPGATEVCADWVDQDCDDLVDYPDIRIADAWVFDGAFPSAVWLGSDMGAAWSENDSTTEDIHYYRFPLSGISAGRSRQVTTDGISRYPSLAYTGSSIGLAWVDDRASTGIQEVYFLVMDEDGFRLTAETQITASGTEATLPSLEWTGSEFGVAWQDRRDGNLEVYFTRLSIDGTQVGTDIRLTNDVEQSWMPDLEWTGSEYAVAWADDRDDNREIYFMRLSSVGVEVGSEIRVTTDAHDSDVPSLSWTGSEFGLSWSDTRDGDEEIYFARISSTGSKIGSDTRITSSTGESSMPFLMWEAGIFGLAWQDQRDANLEIYFVRLADDGTETSAELRLTTGTVSSLWPSMAWTGSEIGVFWTERVSSSEIDVYASYIDFCE